MKKRKSIAKPGLARKPASAPITRIQLLERQLHDSETENVMLREIGAVVNNELNLEKVFQLVAEHAQQLIHAETLLIPILDEARRTYTYRTGCGKNTDEVIGEEMPMDYGVCGWVWRNKRPWWRGMLSELSQDDNNRWGKEAGTLIMVPLIGRRHFLGGLTGINKIGGGDFNKRDLDLLTLFARQVGAVIENAVIVEELEAAKKKAESFQRDLTHLNYDLECRAQERTAELAKLNKKLERMALYDPLTGLPNRSLIQDRLQQGLYVAQRDKRPLAIIMIDLDRFKEVNDTLGHNIGDELLKHVSERISNTLRRSDTNGRLGGDEFAVILPNTDMDGSLITADKILRELEPAFEIEGHTFSIAASLGIALYPEHGKDRDMLLKCADVAMYIAKRANDGYFVYDPKEDKHTTEHLALMGELRAAISNNELELYYQPKIDLEGGYIVGVEALARWHRPEKGFVPPDVFIPVLEQTGLIKPFTKWVLSTALGQCHEWNMTGLDLTMAVNLSMHNLRDPNLPGQLSELLKKWNIKEGALILEITESAVMSNPESVIGILAELKSLGVRFSIDDFGTGHSSLSYLKKLPVSELKIDRSFVMEMNRGKDDAMIVNSTVELAHNLGLRVVAEGVESDDILNSLIALNSDMAQGYYISRPIPPDKLHAFLKTSKWKLTRVKRVNAG